ncbi:hypothetical protein BCR33DRAFT_851916 [Rhizoclosmatium globosum]|uniref:No apical meristem-associated C-terminal domain-containing protein n=1 Tax=Rhizoclosmatium globosum TaxID=329046 RepID=A0A1Y2C4K4_9FUNG|nr:hypothetical protein BCR33DRAFT_851916 [Rhizoclosmatium globosum]|eukprot:ORY41886.1 hypothetical protein BCR33DRAFT_851916 [Rhizoclosmatium globosum]
MSSTIQPSLFDPPYAAVATGSKRALQDDSELPVKKAGVRGAAYIEGEFIAIADAFLVRSMNAITSSDQKAETFYTGIRDLVANGFIGTKGTVYPPNPSTKSRLWNHIQSHWATISAEVQVFIGILSPLLRSIPPSGTLRQQAFQSALEAYAKQNKNKPFKYFGCYQVLHDADKYKDHVDAKIRTTTSRTPAASSTTQTPSTHSTALDPDAVEAPDSEPGKTPCRGREPGVKAAKAQEVKDFKGEQMQRTLEESAKTNKERNDIMKAQKESFERGIASVEKLTQLIDQQGRLAREDKILQMDLSNFKGRVLEYWQKQQEAVLDARELRENI